MSKYHYHVGSNIAGYMPDSDVYTLRTKRDAISASLADARRHVEDSYQFEDDKPARMHGSQGDYWIDDGRSLDTHYWISLRCDCEEGESELAENS